MKNRKKIVERGYEIMAQSNIAICSIVRNCGESLERNIPKVEKLRNKFKNSRVYIFENDSLDNTKEELRKWNKNYDHVIVKFEDGKKETIPTAKLMDTIKISHIIAFQGWQRTGMQYLELLKNCDINIDFMIVIDFDIIRFDIDGLAHSFGLKDTWDVITANGYSFSKKLTKGIMMPMLWWRLAKKIMDRQKRRFLKIKKYGHFLEQGYH